MPAFTLQTKDFEGVRIFLPVGEVDARGARDLQKELLTCIAQGQRSVLVDLAAVEAVAAAGLRVFVAIDERLIVEGGGLALCSPSAAVLKVIETAGLDRTLTFHRRREQALEWLRDTVRQRRTARLATKLLRRRDEPGRPIAALGGPRPKAERETLAVSLLGVAEAAASGAGGPARPGGDADPPR